MNDLKFFIMVAYTIFQAHVMYFTFKIALNIQVNVSHKVSKSAKIWNRYRINPCLY